MGNAIDAPSQGLTYYAYIKINYKISSLRSVKQVLGLIREEDSLSIMHSPKCIGGLTCRKTHSNMRGNVEVQIFFSNFKAASKGLEPVD